MHDLKPRGETKIHDKRRTRTTPAIKFLKDEPSEEDFFGSHGRVADAIAEVIRHADSVNVIGLLGGWGSGKSTVVRQMEKSLELRHGTTATHVFTYDAWLHQNDPPRRAFLEALIGNLTAQNFAKQDDWEQRLADLTGRSELTVTETTRRLSETGTWIFLSLALVPLGLAFLSFDLVNKAFGTSPTNLAQTMFWLSLMLTMAPLLVITFFYFLWRPWNDSFTKHGYKKFLFRKKFWLQHDEAHKDESILALLTNQSIERSQNKTKISPEPSAIEFRAVFRDLLKSLQKHDKHLVIVIDNLDRLAEADALQLWATIRSLFLGGKAPASAERPPAIILPIDESAITRMFKIAHPDEAEILASAFIDKTFDISFHVNEPVMSDWRDYLSGKLSEVFGLAMTPERIYWATRFVEIKSAEDKNDGKVTPRKLIKLVNSTAALATQWGEDIDFATTIYYVLHRREISADVVAFVKRNPDFEASFPNWRRQIAALHFGVAPEKAFQVLLHEPLRSAIAANNYDEFNTLVEVAGAWAIVEEIVEQPPLDFAGSKPDADFVANAALLIAAAPRTEDYASKRALSRLSNIWLEASDLAGMRADYAEVVTCIAPFFEAAKAMPFFNESTRKLGSALSVSAIDEIATKAFIATIKKLEALTKDMGVSLPVTPLTLNAKDLLGVLAELPTSHLRHVQTDKTAGEIGNALIQTLAEENGSASVAGGVRALVVRDTIVFKDKGKIDWDSVANAAGAIIQGNALSHHATGPAIDVIGLLQSSNQTAKNFVVSLFDQGRLKALLDEADSNKEAVILADIAALMLLKGTDFAGPNGKTWEQVMEADMDFANNVDLALSWYCPSGRTMAALDATKTAPSFVCVIRSLVRKNLTVDASSHITPAYLLANLDSLTEQLGEEAFAKCIAKVSKRNDFWPALSNLKVGTAYEKAVKRLNMVKEVDKDQLMADVRTKLEGADKDTWSGVIRNGGALYNPAQMYSADFDRKPLSGDSLKVALTECRPDLLKSDNPIRERWFALAMLVTESARTTMFRSLRDSLLAGTDAKGLDNLIETGGEILMTAGRFADEPDKTARHIVLPLVSLESGRAALQSQMSFFAIVVAKSDEHTKTAIREALEAEADISEDEKESITNLKSALGLG